MAIDLLNLQPSRISRNLKGKFILLFGEPKIGKTTFLSKIPKTLILSFEPGTNALNNVYAQPIKTWSDFKLALKQLNMPAVKEKFDIIGIDTIDVAYDLCMKYICSENDVNQIGELSYGQGYDMAKKEFAGALNDLAFAGYGIIFISHSTERKLKNERDEEYTQLTPALPQRGYDVVNKMVDIIGYIRNVVDKEDNQRKTKIFLRGTDRFWAGSRFAYIEPVVDFSYESVTKALYDAIDKADEVDFGDKKDENINNEYNSFYVEDYSTLLENARELWQNKVNNNEENALKILDKLDELNGTTGRRVRISEITEEKIDILRQIVEFMKQL